MPTSITDWKGEESNRCCKRCRGERKREKQEGNGPKDLLRWGNRCFKQFILHDSVHSLLSCNIQSFCLAMLFLFHANICLGYYDRASDRSPLLSPLECVLSLLFFSFLSEYLHVTMENECCITNASLIQASIVYISLGDDQIHDAVSLYGNKEQRHTCSRPFSGQYSIQSAGNTKVKRICIPEEKQ